MKKLITNYAFDASEKKITFSEYTSINHEGILLITNVLNNQIVYNFADACVGGTVSGNVLTLTYDTTSMSDTDPLQIYYDDAATNPSSEETLEALVGLTEYLKIIINQTKPLATQDFNQRQRVVVDNTLIMPTINATTTSSLGELVIRQESSRNQFANSIRPNLIF